MNEEVALSTDPTKGVAVCDHLVLAIADYEIPGKGFLPLHRQDVIYIIEADASGWWLGVNVDGKKGVLPSTYTVPYVFPVPRSQITEELGLMRLAEDYGVDFASGVPVAPVRGPLPASVDCAPGEYLSLSSMDDLYGLVNGVVVSREALRGDLTASLKRLQGVSRVLPHCCAVDSVAQSPPTGRPTEANSGSAQQLRDGERELEALRRLFVSQLEALSATKEERLSLAKPQSFSSTVVPPHAWYQRAGELVNRGVVDQGSVTVDFGGTGELRDVKRAVQIGERILTELSSNVRESEARYREGKALVQDRIKRRDADVARMLAWWANSAEEARAEHYTAKAQKLREAEVEQQRVTELRYELERKRHDFLRLAEELDEVRAAATSVKRTLRRRGELSELSELSASLSKRISERRKGGPLLQSPRVRTQPAEDL